MGVHDSFFHAVLGGLPKLALWAMRDARTPGQILQTLDSWVDTLTDVLNAEGGLDALALVFRYIAEVEKDLSLDKLHEKLAELSPKTGAAVMTIAEQLRTEGREQGLEQGKREGKAETLAKLLQLKFGEVSPEEAKRIETAPIEQLDAWLARVVTAERRDEVWG